MEINDPSVEVTSQIRCIDVEEDLWMARVVVSSSVKPPQTMAERRGIVGRAKAEAWANEQCEEVTKDITSFVGDPECNITKIDSNKGVI